MSARHQRGYIFEASNAFHVRYYCTGPDGERKQRSHKLCDKNQKTGHGTKIAKAVRLLCEMFMQTVNTDTPATNTAEDLMVVDFWEHHYLPYCEKEWKGTGMRASTVRGFKQVWNQDLKNHFNTSRCKPRQRTRRGDFFQA